MRYMARQHAENTAGHLVDVRGSGIGGLMLMGSDLGLISIAWAGFWIRLSLTGPKLSEKYLAPVLSPRPPPRLSPPPLSTFLLLFYLKQYILYIHLKSINLDELN